MEEWDAVLPDGVDRASGPPPEAPEFFDENYVLPVHCKKPLEQMNSFDLDAKLKFFEGPHIYTIDGVPTTVSVTALAHEFEKPFIASDAITMMKNSRSQSWPRLEYVVGATLGLDEWSPQKGALVFADGKTQAIVHPHSVNGSVESVKKLLQMGLPKGSTINVEDVEIWTFLREKSSEEIEASWKQKGLLARNLGTEAHYQAELYFNGLPCRIDSPEIKIVRDFVRTHLVPKGIVAFRTEMEMVCADADLAGSIDLIVYEPARGLHHIIDFKRSDKLKKDLRGYGKMRLPFNHLDDCKGASYALQTSLYQYVLERDYGLTIGDRVLLSLHPDGPFVTSVPYLKAEAEFKIRERVALVKARREVAKDERFRCAISGAPLVDAVRMDGLVVMDRIALLREATAVPEWTMRREFEERVEACKETVVLDRAACVPWWKQMPSSGIAPFLCQ
jgi:hypothetical protein